MNVCHILRWCSSISIFLAPLYSNGWVIPAILRLPGTSRRLVLFPLTQQKMKVVNFELWEGWYPWHSWFDGWWSKLKSKHVANNHDRVTRTHACRKWSSEHSSMLIMSVNKSLVCLVYPMQFRCELLHRTLLVLQRRTYTQHRCTRPQFTTMQTKVYIIISILVPETLASRLL